ncbi:TonB-dependent receptor [Flavobacterium sp.]|uniref:TonB-dependent receptor n=1 Tax=Flavobacterium sp. TaxID=239 RepID=UPI0024880211|nr:TonB-dependent receptor [Flavobacterium sp.]MDI1316776.1 TonB-dependent receptor [Flavobacterium sp.]
MKNFKTNLLTCLFLLISAAVLSQGKIKGTIVDNELGATLPGVNILIKGTTTGTSTDVDGKFLLTTTQSSGQVVITYIGFGSITRNFKVSNSETFDFGTIKLQPDANALEEVVIRSTVIDIAKDRKTPVAVSTIKAAEIQQKLGNQEFPEILANTPSVYTTKSGGGFGDSRINIRGFSQENIAVMINGVPVNDMENSRVFWSNWAGLSDVTSAMQVQRGLGSSKLAISSVGGTINVVTRTADIKEGGVVSSTAGNDNYLKTLASYSTGKMKNGLSVSVLLSQTFGAGYVDGTKFAAGNYFIGVGYEFNKNHDVQFTFTGAPQWHNQRSAAPTISDYIKYGEGNNEPNIKYNSDWGYLNGEEYSFRTNYYHKPVASLNWDWKINETTKLSTVLYASWGRGGGTSGAGAIRGNRFFANNLKTPNGLIDVDLIQAWNSGQPVSIIPASGPQVPNSNPRAQIGGSYQNSASTSNNGTNGISKIASVNSHNWYGGVINLNKKLSTNLTLDFGLDARTYRGIHYQNITDLNGADNYADNTDINNPGRVLNFEYAAQPNGNPLFNSDYQQKINYNNDGLVTWYGAFSQLEYSTGNLTAFIQGAVSQQGFRRDDFFKYLVTDPLYSTDYKNILGGNVKGGVNYNINEYHNVFANAGYYSKQPFFNAVYPNNASALNENLTNEKIMGLEAGYGFRSSKFNANVNVYRTTWKDRFIRVTANIDDDLNASTPTVLGSAFIQGVEQIHMGAELDFNYKPVTKLSINGMVSVGNWKYGSDVTANYQDDNNNVITNPSGDAFVEKLYINGIKVGDAAQTTASIGATYEILTRFKIDGNYRYIDQLFASIDPTSFKTQSANDKGSLLLPAYGLMDAGFSYKMLVGKDNTNSVNFRFNMNNVLDKIFIAESRTNIHIKNQEDFVNTNGTPNTTAYNTYLTNLKVYDGLDQSNQVYFGFGRTWNFGISYNF